MIDTRDINLNHNPI